MSTNKKQTKLARALQKKLGIGYAAALRQVRQAAPAAPPELAGPPPLRSVDDLVSEGLQSECDLLVQSEIIVLGVDTAQWLTEPGRLLHQIGITEPTIGSIVVDKATTVVDVAEEYEGGTAVCTVTAAAELVVEGLMDRGLAVSAAASGLVQIIDPEFNDHTALVEVEHRFDIEAEFDATVTEAVESLDDLNFLGASLQ